MFTRVAAISVFALVMASAGAPDPGRELSALADEYLQARLETFPEFATQLGLPGARHDRLRDASAAAERAWWKREDAWLARLRRFDAAVFEGRPGWVTYGILREELESGHRLRACRNRLWTVHPLISWQAFYAGLAQQQPVGTPELRAQALTRWRDLPRLVDTEISNLREGVRLGFTAPEVNVRRVLSGLGKLLEGEPPTSPFYSPAARDSTPAFQAELGRLVGGPIRAAVARYRDYLATEYLPKAREEIAITANPGGAECYRAAVRRYTTLDIEPEELHRIGLREVAAAESAAAELSRRSFGSPDYRSLLARLQQEPAYTIASRAAVIPLIDSIIARARAKAPQAFGLSPGSEVVVEPFPAFQEQSVPLGQYLRAALDGSRPGIYRINLYLATKPGGRLELDRLTFHEAVPGHHFQVAIAQERTGVHPVARYLFSSAFGEGWGIYAERVADELELYESDAHRLKDLEGMIYGFSTIVMETGIHAKGWTRQQAIDYETAHTSRSAEQAALDVDRRIGWPGQGLSYMVGYLEIARLRALAQQRLGERFDPRSFHDRVLENGSITLGMLRQRIERWLQ
jgi:uncharacterized protein (DUF885 family)